MNQLTETTVFRAPFFSRMPSPGLEPVFCTHGSGARTSVQFHGSPVGRNLGWRKGGWAFGGQVPQLSPSGLQQALSGHCLGLGLEGFKLEFSRRLLPPTSQPQLCPLGPKLQNLGRTVLGVLFGGGVRRISTTALSQAYLR